MTTEEKLDQLADYRAQRDLLNLQKQELIDAVLTAEIKAKLAEIEAEFGMKAEAVNENIAGLEAEIKAEVIAVGHTVKGGSLMAVWSKGRVSWDSKKLDGMMILIPQLADARKEGDPSVSIR